MHIRGQRNKKILVGAVCVINLTVFSRVYANDIASVYGQDKSKDYSVERGELNGTNYEFIKDDSFYSFRGRFIIKAELDCLLNVTYQFEHISKYASGAKSIEFVRQGENWYDVTYTYRKLLIFENRSTWRRTLKRDEQKIVFEMISNKNNINIMPKVNSSKGYYQIKPERGGYSVEYFQECRLNPGFLKNAYINRAKKEAIQFLQVFKEYVEKTCD